MACLYSKINQNDIALVDFSVVTYDATSKRCTTFKRELEINHECTCYKKAVIELENMVENSVPRLELIDRFTSRVNEHLENDLHHRKCNWLSDHSEQN